MFSLGSFIVVVLFNIYWAIEYSDIYLRVYMFEDWEEYWYASVLIWLYAFWGIVNLVWYLNH